LKISRKERIALKEVHYEEYAEETDEKLAASKVLSRRKDRKRHSISKSK